jgi:hypothetical protein
MNKSRKLGGVSRLTYVLLDYEGHPIRYFDYPHHGTVKVVEPKITFNQILKKCGETLF